MTAHIHLYLKYFNDSKRTTTLTLTKLLVVQECWITPTIWSLKSSLSSERCASVSSPAIRREMIVVSAMGKRPHSNLAAVCYSAGMNMLLLIVVLLLLFGGGGFYFGGPVIGGSGLGLVLLICLIVYFMGGFRSKS
jgi:hypothetical protein